MEVIVEVQTAVWPSTTAENLTWALSGGDPAVLIDRHAPGDRQGLDIGKTLLAQRIPERRQHVARRGLQFGRADLIGDHGVSVHLLDGRVLQRSVGAVGVQNSLTIMPAASIGARTFNLAPGPPSK